MSHGWIDNTIKWLQKKAVEKTRLKKISLKRKLDRLLEEEIAGRAFERGKQKHERT